MLRLDGVSVAIGPVAILRGVSLDVSAGEFVGLIGRNGAGKTTLLRTIMGLLPAASGRVAFASRELADLPTYRRAGLGIGYMPEDRRLVPGLSAEENILLPPGPLARRTRKRGSRASTRPYPSSTHCVTGRRCSSPAASRNWSPWVGH